MKKILAVFILSLALVSSSFADVWVKVERWYKPLIMTEQQWKEVVGNSEVKEITANNFHFEIVNINGKRYIHYFDITEETYWNVIVANGR